ncbi:MAG: PAS domain-containing protein, partial [Butyrivibrio sp.]|nr:PAS domain-containing protein [Butyrivibrio sp.]
MFWKDRNRRFVGASRAFLDYYGFRSIEEILGKTDEDLAWHIDDTPYKTDEIHVIERGETVINAHGKVVVEGVPRDILANKFPAYHDGKIIGLIGYFVDVEQDIKSDEKVTKGNLVDPLTGLLNAQGMMLTMLEFDNNFKSNGQDYNYIFIFINGYNEVLADYGDEIAQKLIKLVARTIRRSFKSTATIARTYGCYFAVCERGESTDTISKEVSTCVESIKEIKEIEKCRCTIDMTYGISMGSEAENVQTIMEIAHKRQEVSFRRRGIDLAFNNTEVLPDIYSDLPLPYVVLKPVMDETGDTVLDMRFLFVNQKYCELTGIAKKDLLGRGYLETFPRTDHAWIDYTFRAVRGEYVNNRLYDGATRHWMQFTAAPSVVPGTCAVVYEVIDSEKKHENQLNAGKSTMVAMINLARMLDAEVEYKTAINNALEYIGEVSGASRVYIFETDRKVFSNSFEWHDNGIGYDNKEHQFKDYKYISLWEKMLQDDTSIVIENAQLLKFDFPDVYNYLKSKGISWLISAPIYHKGKLIGYLGADNFDRDKDIDIRKFMETAAYFLSARLKLHEFYERDIRVSEEKNRLDKEVSTQKIGHEIVSMLWKNEEHMDVLQKVLQKVGELLNPDRLFVMEVDGD